jgi:hypothetical protein
MSRQAAFLPPMFPPPASPRPVRLRRPKRARRPARGLLARPMRVPHRPPRGRACRRRLLRPLAPRAATSPVPLPPRASNRERPRVAPPAARRRPHHHRSPRVPQSLVHPCRRHNRSRGKRRRRPFPRRPRPRTSRRSRACGRKRSSRRLNQPRSSSTARCAPSPARSRCTSPLAAPKGYLRLPTHRRTFPRCPASARARPPSTGCWRYWCWSRWPSPAGSFSVAEGERVLRRAAVLDSMTASSGRGARSSAAARPFRRSELP